jgi:hypothetical protein
VLQWLADETFNNDILRALFRLSRDLDIVRAQDVGLTATGDELVLAWAAEHNRVLLTHDVSTITAHAYRRVMKGEAMPGVFEASPRVTVRAAVEDILLLSECSASGDGKARSDTSRCDNSPQERSALFVKPL